MTNETSKIATPSVAPASIKIVTETVSKDSVRDTGKVRYGAGSLRF